MGRPVIRVLPPELIDQIAAGEVVERPASVVKELVENALDAGAGQVSIELERGGKARIRVVDDGLGMQPEEAELALVRHATSKLSSIDDLFGIATMGFRGEALASIAAVSRLSLTSRAREGAAVGGHRLEVEGGVVTDKRAVGAPVGTAVEVRDLLYNVPARQKFLKGDATETAHINDVIAKLALAHPGVHIRVRHGSRVTLNAPVHDSPLERVRAVWGAKLGAGFTEVTGEERGVRVRAYLGPPERAQSTSRGLQLFVGRRAVRDRGLAHAVLMGYGELVPKGRYPVAIVFVEVPAGELDVNVHPQKLEVRFSDPQRVYAAVRHSVARGAASAPWLQEAQARGPAAVTLTPWAPQPPAPRASELAATYAADLYARRSLFRRSAASRPPSSWSEEPARATQAPRTIRRPSAHAVADSTVPAPTADAELAAGSLTEAADSDFFSGLRYIGQLDRTYLVCERAGEMVLIDQHAAHERVAFARLKERYANRSVPMQPSLFPQTVELDAEQAAIAEEARTQLEALGFELGPFGPASSRGAGGQTWAIKASPADLREGDVLGVVKRLIAELAECGASRASEERIDHVLATIACHSVVRAGDVLSTPEAEALLSSMAEIPFGGYCPHGRPVLLRMRTGEIARRFGR